MTPAWSRPTSPLLCRALAALLQAPEHCRLPRLWVLLVPAVLGTLALCVHD